MKVVSNPFDTASILVNSRSPQTLHDSPASLRRLSKSLLRFVQHNFKHDDQLQRAGEWRRMMWREEDVCVWVQSHVGARTMQVGVRRCIFEKINGIRICQSCRSAREGRRETVWEERRDLFSSFQRSDIWNKETSYVSVSFWDRQTDRGQILPACQINRPRRVGSLRDDSFIHTGKEEHTFTKSANPFILQNSLKASALSGRDTLSHSFLMFEVKFLIMSKQSCRVQDCSGRLSVSQVSRVLVCAGISPAYKTN